MRIFAFICFFSGFLFSNGFSDAIRSGVKEGDIHILFDYTNSNPDISNTRYQNNSFLVTSFGLYYHSAFYGYFRAHIGFRGAVALFQANRNSTYIGGRGDASRDFWDNNKAMLARSYIEYFDGDTSIRIGRLEDSTDLIANHFDGVWFQNKSLGSLLIDFIWINQQGLVLPRELSGFTKFNTKYGGAYYLGATLDVFDFLKLKVYGMSVPQLYSFAAFKASLDTTYVTASSGIVTGFEHKNSQFKDNISLLFNADLGFRANIFYGKLGYIKTGASVGMGSLQLTGNSFSPFFYFGGDVLSYQRNVDLFYGQFGIDSNVIQTYLVYGYNMFNRNLSMDNTRYSQGEVNFYFDWKTSSNTSVIFYLLNTHNGKTAVPLITQTGLALRLGF